MHENEWKHKMINQALKTDKVRGRATDNKRSFVEMNIVAGIGSPNKDSKFSRRLRAKSFGSQSKSVGLPTTTGLRHLKKAHKKEANFKRKKKYLGQHGEKKKRIQKSELGTEKEVT